MNTSIQTRVPSEFLPLGDDFPEPHMAAEACTEIGADEPLVDSDYAWVYGVPVTVLIVIGAVSAALWPY